MPLPRFTTKATRFLRALKRNNDREWFREHRAEYDAQVHAPMIAVIDRLAVDLRAFAPELIADPRRSLYRIHRDTRFSADKSPLKTHIAAVFPPRTGVRHRSAGLYLEVGYDWVWAGGGLYRPEPADLYRIREQIATNYRQLEAIVGSPAFRRQCGGLKGDTLTRVPRPFVSGHPAAGWLRYKQFLAYREFPGEFAASPRFYRGVLAVFEAVAPLVRFLNDAAAARESPTGGHAPGAVNAQRRGRGTGP